MAQPASPSAKPRQERALQTTLKAELLEGRTFDDLDQAQQAFDAWRHRYNHHRPHDALDLAVPADRYQPSSRSFRSIVEPFDYAAEDAIRKVDDNGRISFKGRHLRVSKALLWKTVAVRPTQADGVFDIVFRHVTIRSVDLHQ